MTTQNLLARPEPRTWLRQPGLKKEEEVLEHRTKDGESFFVPEAGDGKVMVLPDDAELVGARRATNMASAAVVEHVKEEEEVLGTQNKRRESFFAAERAMGSCMVLARRRRTCWQGQSHEHGFGSCG